MWSTVPRAVVGKGALALVLLASFGFVNSRWNQAPAPNEADDWERRDCAHDWGNYRRPNDTTQVIGQIAIAPITSNIPEFNDCQKFIDRTTGQYLGLVAVFAHQTLNQQWNALGQLVPRSENAGGTPALAGTVAAGTPPSPTPVGPTAVSAVSANSLVFAEVLNYGARYEPLGIAAGYNCLFLSDTTAPVAVMVPVTADATCIPPARFDTLLAIPGAKELQVKRTKVLGYSLEHYPAVAKWDWDPVNGHQYIGIMCGAAWCEVGEKGFKQSVGYSAGGIKGRHGAVVEIKGWYDEQELALPKGSGSELYPSKIKGTVFPHPMLGSYTLDSFRGKWLPVAYAVLNGPPSEYEEKLNLRPTPPGTNSNALYLCRGSRYSCLGFGSWFAAPWCTAQTGASIDPEKWWIRIGPRGNAEYRCVTRFVPPSDAMNGAFNMVATARWRWLARDETIWEACASGCCQAHALSGP